MPILAQHRLKITYEGGPAEENSLPAYDGATSIDGITRAVQIATHAYMTGEVVTRATALKGASMFIKPARQGSFIFDLIFLIETYPGTTGLIGAVAAAPFCDFLRTAFRRATGSLDAEPESKMIQQLYKRAEPPPLKKPPADLDLLAEALEGSLQDAHRPIGGVGCVETVTIGSSRQGLIQLNEDTKGWVNTRAEAENIEVLRGNLTRYNTLSRNGRAYIDNLHKIVPMRPDGDFPVAELGNLTWSLHGSNIGAHNKVDMRARRVTSASGKVKRLLLAGCERAPAD